MQFIGTEAHFCYKCGKETLFNIFLSGDFKMKFCRNKHHDDRQLSFDFGEVQDDPVRIQTDQVHLPLHKGDTRR